MPKISHLKKALHPPNRDKSKAFCLFVLSKSPMLYLISLVGHSNYLPKILEISNEWKSLNLLYISPSAHAANLIFPNLFLTSESESKSQ